MLPSCNIYSLWRRREKVCLPFSLSTTFWRRSKFEARTQFYWKIKTHSRYGHRAQSVQILSRELCNTSYAVWQLSGEVLSNVPTVNVEGQKKNRKSTEPCDTTDQNMIQVYTQCSAFIGLRICVKSVGEVSCSNTSLVKYYVTILWRNKIKYFRWDILFANVSFAKCRSIWAMYVVAT